VHFRVVLDRPSPRAVRRHPQPGPCPSRSQPPSHPGHLQFHQVSGPSRFRHRRRVGMARDKNTGPDLSCAQTDALRLNIRLGRLLRRSGRPDWAQVSMNPGRGARSSPADLAPVMLLVPEKQNLAPVAPLRPASAPREWSETGLSTPSRVVKPAFHHPSARRKQRPWDPAPLPEHQEHRLHQTVGRETDSAAWLGLTCVPPASHSGQLHIPDAGFTARSSPPSPMPAGAEPKMSDPGVTFEQTSKTD
jgi:hypothetical protein